MSSTTVVPPPVSWAQRADLLYIVINVECKDTDYKFTEDSMHFKGTSVLDNTKNYEVTLNFLNKINPEKVTSKNISRCLEFTIYKQEAGPYWSSLTNDKKKLNFLKVDFNKWVDEDEENEVDDQYEDKQDMLSKVLAMGGDRGMDKPYFNTEDFGQEEEEEDSDDDVLPSLSDS